MSANLNKNGPPSKLAPVSRAVSSLFQAVTSFFSPKKAIEGRIKALNADLAKAVVDSNIPLDASRLAEFRSAQAEVARLQKEVDDIVNAKVAPTNVVLTRDEFAELASVMRSLEVRINELNDLVGVHKSEKELARQEITRLETLNRVWEAKLQEQQQRRIEQQQQRQTYVPLPQPPLPRISSLVQAPRPAAPYLAANQPPLVLGAAEEEEEDEEEDEEEEDEDEEEEDDEEYGEELAATPSFKKPVAKKIHFSAPAALQPTTPINRKKTSSSRRATSNGVNKRKTPTPRVTNKPAANRKVNKSKSTSSKGKSKSAPSPKTRHKHRRNKTSSTKGNRHKKRSKPSMRKRRAK